MGTNSPDVLLDMSPAVIMTGQKQDNPIAAHRCCSLYVCLIVKAFLDPRIPYELILANSSGERAEYIHQHY